MRHIPIQRHHDRLLLDRHPLLVLWKGILSDMQENGPVCLTDQYHRVNSQTRFSVLPEYTPIEETPPPPYSDSLGSLKATENGFGTTAKIAGMLPSQSLILSF